MNKPLALTLKTSIHPRHGYRVLDDQPAQEDVHAFFRKACITQNQADMRDAAQAPEDEAETRRIWLHDTLYADIADTIAAFTRGKRVLEIGCGVGDLVMDLSRRGFAVEGVEISPAASLRARARGLNVHEGAFEALAAGLLKNQRFAAIVFLNILEQLPEPDALLRTAHGLLADDGVLIVRAANDFNPLQKAIRDQLGAGEYWVAADHLSYFSYDTLGALMEGCGFDPVYRQSDFPIELLTLMGLADTRDPAVSDDAQNRLIAFERALPPETRRTLYRAFAQAGMGRRLFMAAKKSDTL